MVVEILIFVLFIIAMIVMVFGITILRAMKGNVKISLERTEFSPGQTVKGTLDLKIKKQILDAKVLAGITLKKKRISHTSKGSPKNNRRTSSIRKNSTRKKDIHTRNRINSIRVHDSNRHNNKRRRRRTTQSTQKRNHTPTQQKKC